MDLNNIFIRRSPQQAEAHSHFNHSSTEVLTNLVGTSKLINCLLDPLLTKLLPITGPVMQTIIDYLTGFGQVPAACKQEVIA